MTDDFENIHADEADPGGGTDQAVRQRESALEKLKRELAETRIDVPQLEGYSLRKARKILRLAGFPEERLHVTYVEDHSKPRHTVVRQKPRAGDSIDLAQEYLKIEVEVSDSSLVHYLPGIYQRSDLTGRNFLADFLWVFQHLFNQTEEKLENLEQYFDPLEAPSDFLPWLASWVAMVPEDDWPEGKTRNLIRKAVELYRLRGTRRGLQLYLEIFTGVEPIIHEHVWPYNGVVEGVYSTVGLDTILMHSADRAHCFTVEIPLSAKEAGEETIRRIHRIIEREKPAHTEYYVVFATDEETESDLGIEVGLRSTIGVDTSLGDDGYLHEDENEVPG